MPPSRLSWVRCWKNWAEDSNHGANTCTAVGWVLLKSLAKCVSSDVSDASKTPALSASHRDLSDDWHRSLQALEAEAMTDPKKDIGANDVRLADVLSHVAENIGARISHSLLPPVIEQSLQLFNAGCG